MADAQLLGNGLLGLVASALFGVAGATVLRRPVSAAAASANRAFATWWLALGAATLTLALQPLLLALGIDNVVLHGAILFLRVPMFGLALWGVFAYLLFVYRGSSRGRVPIAVGYVLLTLALLGLYAYAGPKSVSASGGQVVFAWSHQPPGVLNLLFLAFIVLPILVATVAYASLYGRAPEERQRRRIVLVTLGIALWFAALLVGAGSSGRWVLTDGMQIACPVLVLAAYRRDLP